MTVAELMRRLGTALSESSADDLAAIDVVFDIAITGADSGNWQLRLRAPVGLHEGGGDSDCKVTLEDRDLLALFQNQVSGQQLFFDGRMTIEGDLQQALKLQRLVDLLNLGRGR